MKNIKLEDFNFEGVNPEFFKNFSCTVHFDAKTSTGKRHYRKYTTGEDTLLEILPDGENVQREIYARDFPGQEPSKVEIWVSQGTPEFLREYYGDKLVDYDPSGNIIRTQNVF